MDTHVGALQWEAADRAIDTLDLLRGIWNLIMNHRLWSRTTGGARRPVNQILLGGLPNTHYYGRAADIRVVNGKPIRNNGDDPEVLSIGEALASLPLDQRPDQIIGPPDWTETLGRSHEEGWILDEDQLELHEDHLHVGYRSEESTSNTR